MIRFLLRLAGFLLIAGGFVALVYDGTRWIANDAFQPTPLGKIAFEAFHERFLLLQPAVERHIHPFLWQGILQPLFEMPAFAVLMAAGFLFLYVGQPRKPPIGYPTGRRP